MPNENDVSFDPRCASHHFGIWMIEPEWFKSAVGAVRSGMWKVSQVALELPATQDNRPKRYVVSNGMAVIPIAGPMMKARSKYGGTSTVDTRAAVREAANDDSITSILLLIDSPGGTAAGTDALAQDVAEANKQKPVYAHIEDTGASAAYYVACQARRLTASPASLIGSLGSMMVLNDFSKRNELQGVRTYLITSGGMKGAGTEGAEVTQEQIDYFQSIVDDSTAHFKNAVIRGRKMNAEKVNTLFDGRVHDAAKAKELGLIDEVISLQGAASFIWSESDSGATDKMKPRKLSAEISAIDSQSILSREPNEIAATVAAKLATFTNSNDSTTPVVDMQRSDPGPADPQQEPTAMPTPEINNTSTAQVTPAVVSGQPAGDKSAETITALNQQTIQTYIDRGRTLGQAEGRQMERDRLKSLMDACPGKPELVMNAFITNQGPEAAKMVYDATVNAQREAESRASADKVEIARLQALVATGGHPGVNLSMNSAPSIPEGLSPEAQAELEYDGDPMIRAKTNNNKKQWILFRANQIKGGVRILKTA